MTAPGIWATRSAGEKAEQAVAGRRRARLHWAKIARHSFIDQGEEMNAAIIVLTILGCDDSATECHYVATSERRWPTIETCSVDSEAELVDYANASYPMVIAVCQKPEESEFAAAPLTEPEAPLPQVMLTQEAKTSLASRAISRVRAVLPTTEGVRTLVHRPIRLVEDSYSWVAKRLRD